MDSVQYADPQIVNGLNLYAYCGNNPVMYEDPTGHACWHWALAIAAVAVLAFATIVSAGGLTAGLLALTAAAYGTSAVGASVLTTTLAFATVGAGVTLAASGIVAGIDSIEQTITTGSIINGLNTFLDYGETAMWSTFGSALIGAAFGYFSHIDYGEKTPGKSHSFGTFYNTKNQTITHYSINGNMWWSKHLTNHNRPDLHPVVPHWHAEIPHSKQINTQKELVLELIKRIFGG